MRRRSVPSRGRDTTHRPLRVGTRELTIRIVRSTMVESLATIATSGANLAIVEPTVSTRPAMTPGPGPSTSTVITTSLPATNLDSTTGAAASPAPNTITAATSTPSTGVRPDWWMMEDEDERAFAQREAEALRLIRVHEAELGAQQAVAMRKAEERERWVKAVEVRAKANSKGKTQPFTGANVTTIESLPRIPRRERTPEVSEASGSCDDHLNINNSEVENDLFNYLSQTAGPSTATVLPDIVKTGFQSLPIEVGTTEGPMEWDDDAIPLTAPTTPPVELVKRARSRSRSAPRGPFPDRICRPLGLAPWEIEGSQHSAPGEGRRHKNKAYNPRRHFTREDYFSNLDSDDEMAERLAKEYPDFSERNHHAGQDVRRARSRERTDRRSEIPSRRREERDSKDKRQTERKEMKELSRGRDSARKEVRDQGRARSEGRREDKRRVESMRSRSQKIPREKETARPHKSLLKPTTSDAAVPLIDRPNTPGSSRITWATYIERAMPQDPSITGSNSRDPRRRTITTPAEQNLTVAPPTEVNGHPFVHHFEPTTAVPRDAFDPPPGSCHNCWSPYHRRLDCPMPPAKFCKNCGRKDVEMHDCPRCSKDYPAWRERDRQRRREKLRLQRRGEWQREITTRRGAHLAPHLPNGRPGPQRANPPMGRTSYPPPSQNRPPLNPTPTRPLGNRGIGSIPNWGTPGGTGDAPVPLPEVPYYRQVQELMGTISHLPGDMQMLLLSPLVQQEQTRADQRHRSNSEGQPGKQA